MIYPEVGQTVEVDLFGQPTRCEVVSSSVIATVVRVGGVTFSVRPDRARAIACPVHGLGCEAWS